MTDTLTITELTLAMVRLDLVHEFETSSHRKSYLEHIIVRATAVGSHGRQLVGWGECASPSGPFYCAETTETCWYVLQRYLTPMVLGRPWATPADAAQLSRKVAGNNFARAGLDMACWDLFAQAHERPLARQLSEHAANHIHAGVSLGIERDLDTLLARVAGHVAEGYRRVKLKISPGWDLEPTRAVRSAFPDLALQVDANGAYDSSDVGALLSLDELDLLMLEQPFSPDDLLASRDLARRMHTPICLDESISSAAALRTALTLQACSVVNVKVSRLGGIGPAKEVHDICVGEGVPAWCGGMHEFGIGRAANLAIASLPGFTLPSDVSGSDKYYRRDIVTPPIKAIDGLVPVPAGRPGIAVTVDEAEMAKHTVRAWTVAADERTVSTRKGLPR
ncbi:MAG: o-succinylbenzoate synthase [Terracoccus sp.]